jgi:alkaline phosphatase
MAAKAQTPDPAILETTPSPRNVILIIGDGMDDQQITIARNYLKGMEGQLLLDSMPLRGAVQVLAYADTTDKTPVYVADSANTATSMATGEITSRGRISTSPGDDRDLTTIIELAEAAGYRTGLVSTSSVTDATPAAFAAHVSVRVCENPDAMVEVMYRDILLGDCSDDLKTNGGPGSIAEQLAVSGVDVILGGGSKHFAPVAEGSDKTVLAMAQEAGFTTLDSVDALAASAPDQRLLGLFAASHLPVRLRGEDGREAEAPEPSMMNSVHRYLGDVEQPAVMTCEPNPDFTDVPSLQQMTDIALRNLSHDNDKGFFLMIESASVDKQAHERKPCGSIGEMEQLEEALASALAFAEQHPDTLVLVTADHSQAAQLIPYESLFARYPIPIYSPGKVARIRTPEGSVMVVNYATTNFVMEEHTGGNVPLFGNAVAMGRVPPFTRQPDLFDLMRDYLALN